MANRIGLPPEEEKKRKAKMVKRLSFLFALLNLALIGVIVFEVLQLVS